MKLATRRNGTRDGELLIVDSWPLEDADVVGRMDVGEGAVSTTQIEHVRARQSAGTEHLHHHFKPQPLRPARAPQRCFEAGAMIAYGLAIGLDGIDRQRLSKAASTFCGPM